MPAEKLQSAPASSAAMWRCPFIEGLELKRARHSTFSFGRHRDERYVICLIEEGAEAFSCRGIRYVARRGGIVALHPEDVHDGGSADGGSWAYRCFHLPELLMRRLAARGRKQESSPFFSQNLLEDPALAARLTALHRELELGVDGLQAQVTFHETFTRLLARHGRPGGTVTPDHSGRAHPSLRLVREYLEDHFAGPVLLEDLSGLAGLSPFHLLREFKQQFGLPPHVFLQQIRVQRARELLARGIPIAAVAIDTGFFDQSHFTRVFKRFTGITPGQFQPAACQSSAR